MKCRHNLVPIVVVWKKGHCKNGIRYHRIAARGSVNFAFFHKPMVGYAILPLDSGASTRTTCVNLLTTSSTRFSSGGRPRPFIIYSFIIWHSLTKFITYTIMVYIAPLCTTADWKSSNEKISANLAPWVAPLFRLYVVQIEMWRVSPNSCN